MAVSPGESITLAEISALFGAANGKTNLPGTPYSIIEVGGSFVSWVAGASYNSGVGVIYNGNPFISKINGNTFLPTNSVVWQGATNRGAWNSNTTYNPWDSVTYGGFTYIAPAGQGVNVPPLNETGNLNGGWVQQWLQAYNRMRLNFFDAFSGMAQSISGPWPLTGITNTMIPNSGILDFYYEDFGNAITVTNTVTMEIESYDQSQYNQGGVTSVTIRLLVGGDRPVNFNGRFLFDLNAAPVTANCTSDFPGGSFGINTTDYPGSFISNLLNVTVSPGIYTFAANVTGTTFAVPAALISCGNTVEEYASISISFTPSSAFVSGVDNLKNIKKISIDTSFGGYGFGIYNWYPFNNGVWGWKNGIVPGYIYPGNWATSQAGIFFGCSPAINTLGMMLHSSMPWNLLYNVQTLAAPTSGSNVPGSQPLNNPYTATITITGTTPNQQATASAYANAYGIWEKENTPPAWKANTWYPAGFQIQDSNGNIQTAVGGLTGQFYPGGVAGFSTTLGGTTTEGGYKLNGNVVSAAKWVCTKVLNKNIPSTWKPIAKFPIGSKISDSNWNTQTVVSGWFPNHFYPANSIVTDSNGIMQLSSAGGTSGAIQPPWNSGIGQTTNDGSVVWTSAGSSPTTSPVYPPAWQTVLVGDWNPHHTYSLNDSIMDSNGNYQVCANTTPPNGVSGGTVPVWGNTTSAVTNDGSVVWHCVLANNFGNNQITNDGGVMWRLTSVNGLPIAPARAKAFSTPKYPVVKLTMSSNYQNNHPYHFGDTIIDSNLGTQQCVDGWIGNHYWAQGTQIFDKNGNVQQVISNTGSGNSINLSGVTEPNWATTLNATTVESTSRPLTWQLVALAGTINSGASIPTWGTTLNGITNDPGIGADGNGFSPPIPTHLAWKLTQVGTNIYNLPANFNPVGWWIYRVAINRLGVVKNGVAIPQSGTVPVTLGCIRNGAFVAFGTYNTGQTIDAMWPIFTSSPLVYQCPEQVDVQAEAISCGLGLATGGSVTYPICAAFYNDMMALLNLIT